MTNNGYSAKKNQKTDISGDFLDLFGDFADESGESKEPSGSLSSELDQLFGEEINPKSTLSNLESNLDELLHSDDRAASDADDMDFETLFNAPTPQPTAAPDLDLDDLMAIGEEHTVNEAQIESDLETLFGKNDTLTNIPEEPERPLTPQGKVAPHAEKDVVAGLESLFAASPSITTGHELEADFDHYFATKDQVPSAKPSPPPAPVATSSTPKPQPVSQTAIAYYHPLEDLHLYLDQPSQPQSVNWQALEVLIQAPACPPPIIPTPAAIAPPVAVPQKKQITISKETEDFGDLEALLQEADQTMGGPPTVASPGQPQGRIRPQKVNAFEQTMRIPVKQLDNLSNLMGELVVNRNSLEQSQEKLRQFLDSLVIQVQRLSDIGGRMQDLYERSLLERSLLASRGQALDSRAVRTINGHLELSTSSSPIGEDYDPLEMDQFTGFHLLSQEMIELIVRVRESSSDIEFLVDDTEQIARNLRQVSTQLQEGLTKSRMIPFAQAADRLVRPVREISLKLNKKATLQVEGREALIDKMILEQLYDPLTHLINNAITHGIETPDIRTNRGKSPTGTISLKAFLQGNQIVIAIADDGAGIDPDVIIRKALEKNLITPGQIKTLSQQEVYDFIFHPGFSTKDQADDFAGRGVGMDVVRTALGSIRGTITIDSILGRGTTFTIRLPLTLNICKALCCLNHHARIALPMDGVEDMQDYSPNQIEVDGSKKYIRWRNSRLRIHPLNNLLTHHRRIGRSSVYGSAHDPDQIPIVILRSAGNLLALQVDQVIGEQEIVIKQIEGPIPKPAGISGATVLGDGTVMPVADILELLELAAQGRVRTKSNTWQDTLSSRPAMDMVKTEPMVLIVDDSITVRELLSISFTKAGYRVEQARDGQEAWDKLRGGLPCDLVFCDIEMPRVDGLELLSRIQKDPDLAKIPVAMLTSRGADRHRQMAAQLGASAYFTKPYLEEALLDAALKMRHGDVLLPGSVRQPNILPDTTKLAIEEAMGDAVQQATPVETLPIHPPTKTNFKALIIDDSVTVRELLAITFQNAGYVVEKARDGQDALNQLLESPDFDVVFCDIEMPRIDGLELLNRIREHPELAGIPIAMLTSRGAERHRKIAAERGAKAYFTKPYVEENLLRSAKRLIKGEVLLDENGTVLA